MLPERFLGKCSDCKIVIRCPNEQAYKGRVELASRQLRESKRRLREIKIRRMRLLAELWYVRTFGRVLRFYLNLMRKEE